MDTGFLIFAIKYLRENEKVRKTVFACLYGAQVKSVKQKKISWHCPFKLNCCQNLKKLNRETWENQDFLFWSTILKLNFFYRFNSFVYVGSGSTLSLDPKKSDLDPPQHRNIFWMDKMINSNYNYSYIIILGFIQNNSHLHSRISVTRLTRHLACYDFVSSGKKFVWWSVQDVNLARLSFLTYLWSPECLIQPYL